MVTISSLREFVSRGLGSARVHSDLHDEVNLTLQALAEALDMYRSYNEEVIPRFAWERFRCLSTLDAYIDAVVSCPEYDNASHIISIQDMQRSIQSAIVELGLIAKQLEFESRSDLMSLSFNAPNTLDSHEPPEMIPASTLCSIHCKTTTKLRHPRFPQQQFVLKSFPLSVFSSDVNLLDPLLLRAETRTLLQFSHKHLVKCISIYPQLSNHQLLCYMEWIEGGTLAQYIYSDPRVDETILTSWLEQTVAALSYFHARGIPHGNLKPQNILLDGAALRVRVTGMELTVLRHHSADLDNFIRSSPYASYEMASTDICNIRDDTWAVGLIWAELLTRRSIQEWTQMSFCHLNEADRQRLLEQMLLLARPFSPSLSLIVQAALSETADRPTADALLKVVFD